MDLTRQIDIYCERIGPGLWAEPVNAVSNLAFILAALWAWRLARRRGGPDAGVVTLIALTAAIGVGSFLFHTFATRWAAMTDVIPIQLFCLAYAYVAIRRFFGFPPLGVAVGIAAAIAAGIAVANLWPRGMLPDLGPFARSMQYAPAFLALTGLGLALAVVRHPAWPTLAAASATLLLSLYLRGVDHAVCAEFPLGTHFGWHLLNGLMFAFVLRAVIVHGRPKAAAGAAP